MVKSFVIIVVLFSNGQTGTGKFEFTHPATCEKVWHYVMSQPNVLTADIFECSNASEEEAQPAPQSDEQTRHAIAPLTNG